MNPEFLIQMGGAMNKPKKIDYQQLPIRRQFHRRLIRPSIWIINPFDGITSSSRAHLIVGSKYAAVVDTTNTSLDIRKYIEECVTDKPLLVLSTHAHADHVKNNCLFEGCPIYMSDQAWQDIQKYRDTQPDEYPGSYIPRIIEPGDRIRLGDHEVECIGFGGNHSHSSISYFDSKTGCLFPGDEFDVGQVLLLADRPGCVERYRDDLISLREQLGERLKFICPPHNGSPCDPLTLDYMIENCERILMGCEGSSQVESMSFGMSPFVDVDIDKITDPKTRRRSEWKGTSIVYDVNRVYIDQSV